jgi:predicted RNA-binding protein associated with RNAse of E/G family
MLNRKFADLRHSPRLDPRVLSYDASALPQAVVEIGPRAQRKTKGGVVLAEPGFTWAIFLLPDKWYAVESVYDRSGRLVAHHVDICRPLEETDGMLSFLDLKLDLLIRADGDASWLDQDDYQAEMDAGTISPAWQRSVAETAAQLDRERARGAFPPDVIRPRGQVLKYDIGREPRQFDRGGSRAKCVNVRPDPRGVR